MNTIKTSIQDHYTFQTIAESSTPELANFLLYKANLSKGDIICDPFAGAGIIGLQAAIQGIHSTNIELSKEIFRIMEFNFHLLQSMKSPLGLFTLLCGDSRLVTINTNLSAIITSPPFTLSDTSYPPKSLNEYKDYIQELGKIFKRFMPFLLPNARIVVLIGGDWFKGTIIPLQDLFTKEMVRIGYCLVSSQVKNLQKQTKILVFKKINDNSKNF